MSRNLLGVALVLVLATSVAACQKLPDQARRLPMATLDSPEAVPLAWGSLVGVSSVAENPDLVQLWFQDSEKVIRVVVFRPKMMQIVDARLMRRSY